MSVQNHVPVPSPDHVLLLSIAFCVIPAFCNNLKYYFSRSQCIGRLRIEVDIWDIEFLRILRFPFCQNGSNSWDQ